jgi:hypothetical protein
MLMVLVAMFPLLLRIIAHFWEAVKFTFLLKTGAQKLKVP